MKPQDRGKAFVWVRRAVQMLFLGLFVWLFWSVRAGESAAPGPWLRFFFNFDPLVLAGTWLASHEAPAVLLFSLVTLAATLLLGRVFCGWVCPLGAVNTIAGRLRPIFRKARPRRDAWTPWQRGKYYLLAGLLVMALFGVQWLGVFDPLSLLYRATAAALLPGAQYVVEEGSNAIYQADPHVGSLRLTSVSEPVYRFLREQVFIRKRQVFTGGPMILFIFAAIVALNLYRRRFWCRYVCPLGALLGTCSPRPALRLTNLPGCTNCGRCAARCPAAADPDKPGGWRSTECFGCWNCVAACKANALDFRLASPLPAPSQARLDLSKRALLSAGVSGVGGLVLFRLTPQSQAKLYNPALIRPPGARPEREFLKRCLRCGLCMKACPTNALQPAGLEAGLEGVWTPNLTPQTGYCDYNCVLCGQVCPTEAIQPLPLEEKRQVKIGLATFDRTRCLPYAYDRECMICEEHCPLPKKAIFFVPTTVTLRSGAVATVKQPRVDPDLCIGCGICENACVFKDRPAIRVTSANETRHPGNRPILAGFTWEQAAPADNPPAGSDPYASAPNSPY